jgi:hypothetical protein
MLPINLLNGPLQLFKEPWNITKIPFGKNVINHQVLNNDTLKVYYPNGSYSPSRGLIGGMGFYASPKEIFPNDDVTFNYSVLFDETFDPNLGGKLPGLFISNGSFFGASGGRFNDYTASCRIAWRKNFDAEAYIYAPKNQDPTYYDIPGFKQNVIYGDSLWRGKLKFNKNEWNNVSIRIKLNTIGEKDGLLQVSINSVTFSFDKLIWRNHKSVHLSAMIFETFFGGSSPRTATPVDTWTYFKNLTLNVRV